jgi:hypothetical protein
MNTKILLAALLFCISTIASAQTTFYVSTTGNDSGDGSASAPFRTIEYAATKVQENVETVIYLQENATFALSGGGNACVDLGNNKNVSIIGRNTTLLAAALPGREGGEAYRILRAVGTSILKVKGLIFRNGRQIEYVLGGGIYFAGNELEIDSCKFYNNEAGSSGGAIGSRGQKVTVRNSYFEGNWLIGGGGSGGVIMQAGKNGTSSGNSLIVHNCTFYQNNLSQGGKGIAIGVWDQSTAGGRYSTLNYLEVVNCTFVENTSKDPYQAAIDISDNTDLEVCLVNNTFYNNDGALRISYSNKSIALINNLILANRAGVFGDVGLTVADGRDPLIAWNNYISGKEAGVNQYIDDDCFNAQKATYHNTVAINATHPQVGLATTLTNDFVPCLPITSETSPLVNAGLANTSSILSKDLVPAKDILGRGNNGAKDIGAFEYGGTSSIAFPQINTVAAMAKVIQTDNVVFISNISGRDLSLTVYDVTGRIAYSTPITGSASIDKSLLPKGVAILRFDNGVDRQSQKIFLF